MKRRLIPIRVCSPMKSRIARGHLWEIYTTPMLQAFFHVTRYRGAILSRKYGISLWSSMHENYSDNEMLSDANLLALLKLQQPRFKDAIFLYWNHRPLTHDKWVAMMREAGFTVEEYRTLAEIKERMDTGRIRHVKSTPVSAMAGAIERRVTNMGDEEIMFTLRNGKTIIGEAKLVYFKTIPVYLDFIYIADEYKQQKYGTQLMRAIVTDLDNRGRDCELIASTAFHTPLPVLIEFYRKFGFAVQGKVMGYANMYRPASR